MKYKAGDRVRIKSLDWHNENKSKSHGTVVCGSKYFYYDMREWCGKTMTILDVYQTCYIMKEDGAKDLWTDEMIEGLMEEETKPNIIEEAKTYWNSIKDAWICPEGYIFKDENGNVINAQKIVLEKKKKQYPKTYEECCKVLDWNHRDYDRVGYKSNLLCRLQVVLLCRDAYWKIAGEEMGLDKPWKPDYDSGVDKYGIICMNGVVQKSNPTTNWERHLNKVFEFPTAEMRDAFTENFDPDIEFCKELL